MLIDPSDDRWAGFNVKSSQLRSELQSNNMTHLSQYLVIVPLKLTFYNDTSTQRTPSSLPKPPNTTTWPLPTRKIQLVPAYTVPSSSPVLLHTTTVLSFESITSGLSRLIQYSTIENESSAGGSNHA